MCCKKHLAGGVSYHPIQREQPLCTIHSSVAVSIVRLGIRHWPWQVWWSNFFFHRKSHASKFDKVKCTIKLNLWGKFGMAMCRLVLLNILGLCRRLLSFLKFPSCFMFFRTFHQKGWFAHLRLLTTECLKTFWDLLRRGREQTGAIYHIVMEHLTFLVFFF